MNDIGAIKNNNILFLQGPMGTFFKKLDKSFSKRGATTYKIGFNAADSFFSNHYNYVPFRAKEQEWEYFITNFLKDKKINKVFLFGDCRFYQSVTIQIAMKLSIEVFVFEEGYIRPDYITMEKYGVNDFSHICRDPNFYKNLPCSEEDSPKPAFQSKAKLIFSAMIYYSIANLLHFRYPYYKHHRDFSAIKEAFYGVRSFIRKIYYPLYENKYKSKIETTLSKKYFFVPIQTHNDFQILQHSGYLSIEKFILDVLDSFMKYAADEHYIIFKHHPVDRGQKNYTSFIMEQSEIYGIEDKVLVFHDLYLPTLIKNAIGAVTINSTVGLTSVSYGIPTKTLGNAIYNIEGLCNKDVPLQEFWSRQQLPDLELYKKYRAYLVQNTQLNGSFYGAFPDELKAKTK
jgi:capsular polysaccharide export protein